MKPDKQSLEKKREQQREKPWAYVVKKKVKVITSGRTNRKGAQGNFFGENALYIDGGGAIHIRQKKIDLNI